MKVLALFVLGVLWGVAVSSMFKGDFNWTELFMFLVISIIVFPIIYLVNRKTK